MANENWTTHPRVVKVRTRSAAADLLVRAADNFRVHRTGRNATLVAHYGFLSVFPLLLVFTTVLGFVLESRPKLRETIIDSAFSRIPIIGQQLETNPNELKGNAVALILGLLLAIWAGMRAFNALQVALDDIADVPMDDRPNLFRTRGRSLLGIGIVGVAQVGTAVLTGFIGVTGVRGLVKIGFALSAIAVNTAVLLAVYRWLCVRTQSWRQVAPGAVVAGFAFAVLQVAGTAIVGRSIAKASPVYGTFASVIGLITWLGLHSTIALLGAELNRALPPRRYRPGKKAVLTPDC